MEKSKIETEARKLQFEVWSERKVLWPNTQPPVAAMFEPRVITRILGLEYDLREQIAAVDTSQRAIEAAGTLDRRRGIIAISTRFQPSTQRFTAAHEIGHFVLHPWIGDRIAHRDRAVFEIGVSERPQPEQDADYFAACLLVPSKLLQLEFEKRFGTRKPLPMTETVVFHLGASPQIFSAPLKSLVFAKAVATARSFDRARFPSLTDHFNVSPTAMAIRLREVGLVVD